MGNAEKRFMSRTEIMIGDGLASLDRFVQSVTEDLGYQVRVTTGSGSSRRSGASPEAVHRAGLKPGKQGANGTRSDHRR